MIKEQNGKISFITQRDDRAVWHGRGNPAWKGLEAGLVGSHGNVRSRDDSGLKQQRWQGMGR